MSITDPLDRIRTLMARALGSDSVEEARSMAVIAVREIAKHDYVLISKNELERLRARPETVTTYGSGGRGGFGSGTGFGFSGGTTTSVGFGGGSVFFRGGVGNPTTTRRPVNGWYPMRATRDCRCIACNDSIFKEQDMWWGPSGSRVRCKKCGPSMVNHG